MLAKLIAVVIHEVQVELRKLDVPDQRAETLPQQPGPAEPSGEQQRHDLTSTTACSTERAAAWDHDTRPPVTARFGFGPR